MNVKLANILVCLLACFCAVALFVGPAAAGPPSGGGGLVIADFNGDGDDDILFRNLTDGFVGFWYLNGAVIFDGFGLPDPGPAFSIVGAGYFDDDLFADVLWVDDVGNMTIWFMADKAIGSSSGLGSAGAGLDPVGIGDIDNNGNSDIIFQDASSVATWLFDNGSFLAGASIGTIPAVWAVVGMGDIDLDDKADILFRNTTDGFVGFWTLDGSQVGMGAIIKDGAGVPDPGVDWTMKGFGDTNKDGSADVVWVNAADNGSITAWQLAPNLTIGGSMGYGFASGLDLVAIGDTDASDNSDFIFQDATSVAEWMLADDGSVASGASVGSIASTWVVKANVDAN
jgi:hypothetical protein